MGLRLGAAALVALSVACAFASCMLPFEEYDPREAATPTTTALGGGGAGASTSTSSGGSNPGGGGSNTGGAGNTGGAQGGSGGNGGSGGAPGGSGGAPGGSGGAPGGSGGAPGGSGGNGGAGGAPILHVQYTADIAECINPAAPNPDVCEQEAGAANMEVDLQAGAAPYHVNRSFVRFTLDQAIAGRTVLDVLLRVTVTTDLNANSTTSGEIWTVSSFDLASLSSAAPTPIALVSPDQGAVVQNQVVSFPLGPGLVSAGQPLHLGLLPTSTNGVDYWNLGGPAPPLLLIDYQ